VYPLYELVVEEEPANEEERGTRETMFESNDDDDDDSDQDLEQDDLNAISGTTRGTNDPTTVYFFCRTANAKDQCVRYHRGYQPLWLRSEEVPPDIPDCPYCNAPRQFEFQLQPQLLHFFNRYDSWHDLPQKEALLATCAIVENTPPEQFPPQFKETHDKALEQIQSQLLAKPKNELDWGVVAVYTCTASCGDFSDMCDEELGAYREEYAYVQPSL
jgi:pre-rRNA-processing protein TSR4